MNQNTVRLLIFAFLLMTIACRQSPSKMFSKVSPSHSNINFKNLLVEDEQFNVLNYPYFYNGGGVALGDINNDGLTDIFFTGNMVKNRLYLNKGDFEFEDITQKSTVADKQGWCTGVTMADVNADGWLDIYICRSADISPEKRRNLLFINNHDNTFTERAEEFGVADKGYSTHAAFVDYDLDNDLDLIVINHSSKDYMQGAQEKPGIRSEVNPNASTHVYRNDNGHYSNVTAESGITSNILSFGLGLGVGDLNNDGWPDIYISNDFNEGDYCFINQRNGTFREAAAQMFSYTSLFSMGNAVADIDNDGFNDVVTLDMLPEGNYLQKMHNGAENFDKFQLLFNNGFLKQYSRNMLQLNRGGESFEEIGQFSGISNTDWSWAPLVADFDNDGLKDIFITNGYVKDYTDMDYIKYSVDMVLEKDPVKRQEMMKDRMNKLPTIKMANYMMRNNGQLNFVNKAGEWGLDDPSISAGAAYADLDNDGDLDIITNNSNEEAGVYRNNLRQLNASEKYIQVKLSGTGENKFGIGSKIVLHTKAGNQVQELWPSCGFQSSVDYKLHFGIGASDSVTHIEVFWPGGVVSRLENPPVNQLLSVERGEGLVKSDSVQSTKPPVYFKVADTLSYKHTENKFNDFTQQGLLPQWFSRQGPAMAKGDINGDGLEDVFIGGALGQAGVFFIRQPGGDFTRYEDPVLTNDRAYEDITAAIFDVNGDGHNDLFVGSGGYELNAKDSLLQNRIYLNNGRGKFKRVADALPADFINDNALTIADFNGDGRKDIFVGGFCIPGQYPAASGYQLLINEGNGKFTNRTDTWLASFDNTGLFTAASAADFNGDGKPDLAVTGHWMEIQVWLNKGNRFERSEHSASGKGLFNALVSADLDGDGDIDIIAGNQGLNTQFKTTSEEPMELYYADFDGNGTSEPVISYYIDHKRWPIYSRDDLMQQIPYYNNRYLYYSDYAKADITEIFKEKLGDASHFSASDMTTQVLENTGEGFVVHPLPREAQWYPVYALALLDLNADGLKDIVMGGNQSFSRIKFGAYGSGRGDIFLNKGKFIFERMHPAVSGVELKGDIRNIESFDDALLFGINDQSPLLFKIKGK